MLVTFFVIEVLCPLLKNHTPRPIKATTTKARIIIAAPPLLLSLLTTVVILISSVYLSASGVWSSKIVPCDRVVYRAAEYEAVCVLRCRVYSVITFSEPQQLRSWKNTY